MPATAPPDTIRVGTRKGLVTVVRRNGTWEVGDLDVANVSITALCDRGPDAPLIIGALHGHFGPKIYATADGGRTIEDMATPANPPPDATELIWSLAATSDGTLWCGTMPGALHSSTDDGASWDLNEALWNQPSRAEWFGGGFDDPAIHSIVTDPRSPDRLAVAISCGGAWTTADGGASWEVGTGMAAAYMPPGRAEDPTIQDPHRVVRSPADPDVLWTQHHCGIYRSIDDGRTWSEITEAGPSTFGFAVAAHPHDADTAWFVPAIADEERIPVDGKFVVTRTRDGGKTFDVLDRGLPEGRSWDLVYRHAFDVDGTGERLAMGSTTGNLWVSEDSGDSWTLVNAHLPPIAVVQFATT